MGSVAEPANEHLTMRVINWAPCRACNGQLELREEPDDGQWVHVDPEGDYMCRDHCPEPKWLQPRRRFFFRLNFT